MTTPIPQAFIDLFVRKSMRERVMHEWLKKPGKLQYRICHQADKLFDDAFKGQRVVFLPQEPVLVLGIGKHEQMSYTEAEKLLGHGGGMLIIAINGEKFIAETEAEIGHPSVVYAGSALKPKSRNTI